MFCSLVHVLVNTKAMPSMVGKLIFEIEALSFQVFMKYFLSWDEVSGWMISSLVEEENLSVLHAQWVAHAPGMPGTFSLPPTSKETASERSRHASRHVRHACAVMHVGIAKPRWCGKRSRHFRCMQNPHFYLSCKRPIPRTLRTWWLNQPGH